MNFIGVDLGQAADFTAISVVEQIGVNLAVRHLERVQLGTPYPKQVERIQSVYTKCLPDPVLIVDHTGVGRAVVDLIRETDMRPIALSITGGIFATRDGLSWTVPKRDLVSALIIAFQTGQIKIAKSLPEAETLIRELQNFKLKINLKTGHDSYEAWREGVHDDLVLSVALAVYAATWTGGDRPTVDEATGAGADIPDLGWNETDIPGLM